MRRRPPRSTLFPYTTHFRARTHGSFFRRATPLAPQQAEGRPGPRAISEVRGYRQEATRTWRPIIHQAQFLEPIEDRKSTRLNSSHANISYAVFCLKKQQPLI